MEPDPKFGERTPPPPKRERTPFTAANWVAFIFILVLIASLIAPLVIWVWRLALGMG